MASIPIYRYSRGCGRMHPKSCWQMRCLHAKPTDVVWRLVGATCIQFCYQTRHASNIWVIAGLLALRSARVQGRQPARTKSSGRLNPNALSSYWKVPAWEKWVVCSRTQFIYSPCQTPLCHNRLRLAYQSASYLTCRHASSHLAKSALRDSSLGPN
jgi:hypothetical protein